MMLKNEKLYGTIMQKYAGRERQKQMKTDRMTEMRISEMISQMTVEEKVGQMQQISLESFRPEVFERFKKLGAGSFLHVLGEEADEIRALAAKTRMKIPPIFGIDAIHGHSLLNGAVIFPSQLAVSCSWNPALVKKMGKVTAREVNADGLDWVFSPVLCLGRDTRRYVCEQMDSGKQQRPCAFYSQARIGGFASAGRSGRGVAEDVFLERSERGCVTKIKQKAVFAVSGNRFFVY